MAAGLRQRLAADHEARRLDQPFLDGLHQRIGRAAEIAHRGEAAMQHVLHDVGGVIGDERVGQHRIGAQIGHGRDHVDVAIDQARHQRLAREVDHRCARRGDRLVRDFADAVALDEDVHARNGAILRSVKQGGVGEENHRHGKLRQAGVRAASSVKGRTTKGAKRSATRIFSSV